MARTRLRKRPASAALPLGDVIDTFLREHVQAKRKASTAAWMRDALERIVKPALGAMKPDKVTRQDAARLHSSMNDRPVQANRTLAILSALFSWAGKNGYVEEGYNPARGLEKLPERSRERFLTNEEFARLADALRQGGRDDRRDDRSGDEWRLQPGDRTAYNAQEALMLCTDYAKPKRLQAFAGGDRKRRGRRPSKLTSTAPFDLAANDRLMASLDPQGWYRALATRICRRRLQPASSPLTTRPRWIALCVDPSPSQRSRRRRI
jgi:integrase